MTIAIGAKYPWGDLKKLPPPGVNIPEAIILASDSRFSHKTAEGHVPISDIGTKLFPLGNDFAAVYAGISAVGELCFDELRWRLSRETNPNSVGSRNIAENVFNSVYRQKVASMKLKPEDAPLYILLGVCSNKGQTELYRFSYANAFRAEPISGVNALAWPETAAAFGQSLEKEVSKKVEDELSLRSKYPQVPMASWVPMPIQPEHMAMLVTAILNSIIESGSDATIGGMVQCAIITPKGVTLPEISFSPDPTNEGPGWTRTTARPGELIRVTNVSDTFGSHSVAE